MPYVHNGCAFAFNKEEQIYAVYWKPTQLEVMSSETSLSQRDTHIYMKLGDWAAKEVNKKGRNEQEEEKGMGASIVDIQAIFKKDLYKLCKQNNLYLFLYRMF